LVSYFVAGKDREEMHDGKTRGILIVKGSANRIFLNIHTSWMFRTFNNNSLNAIQTKFK